MAFILHSTLYSLIYFLCTVEAYSNEHLLLAMGALNFAFNNTETMFSGFQRLLTIKYALCSKDVTIAVFICV